MTLTFRWRRWCLSSQIPRLMLYFIESNSAFIWTFVILPLRRETLLTNPWITRISFRHSWIFLMVKNYIINCVRRTKSTLTKYRCTSRSHPSMHFSRDHCELPCFLTLFLTLNASSCLILCFSSQPTHFHIEWGKTFAHSTRVTRLASADCTCATHSTCITDITSSLLFPPEKLRTE